MSTVEVLGQLQLGTNSSKIALEKLYLAASSVDQSGSSATTGRHATGALRPNIRLCDHHTTPATLLGSATTCSRAAACLVHHVHHAVCGTLPGAPHMTSGGS